MVKDALKRSYTLQDRIHLAVFLIKTKIFYHKARLIRFPFIIRGKKYIDLGCNLTTGYWCRFEVFPINNDKCKRLILGNDIQMNDFVHISAIDKVEIGDGCLFASHIYISDNTHGRMEGGKNDSSPDVQPDHREYVTAPVKIGKNVWLGEGVIVLPGVSIGDGSVIGAHSVVSKNIPPACVAVGSPAKVIKKYSFEQGIWVRV